MRPVAPNALRPSIQAAREAGDHDLALALLEQAKEAQPRAAWPWVEEIAVQRERGARPEARALAHALLERDPMQGRAWLQLGLLEREAGAAEAALAAFTRAHDLDPKAVEPVLHMSQETFSLGRQAESDALMRLALDLDDKGVQALTLSAQRAMMANDAARALPLFQTAIQRCPWHVNSYIGACNALVKLGRIDEAMETIDRALEACGSRPVLHTRRVQLLRDLGFYAEAKAVAEAALVAHEDSFPLWEATMRLTIMTGEEAAMRAWAARARPAKDSERATAQGLLGDMEAELGNQAAALDHYRAGAALAPTQARMHGAAAVACLTSFDIAGAHAHLRRQTAMLAPSLRLKNRSDNPAQSYYGQIINEYRLDPSVTDALALLPPAPEPRIAALRDLCAEHPGSTLAAAALVDALCRNWPDRAEPSPAPEIPRTVAQYWDAAQPPADIASIMKSWPQQNPGYRHLVFDDLRARAFLHAHHAPEVLHAYHRATAPAMKADLFRLAFLLTEGGVYADADDRCTQPLAPLLPAGAALVLYREYLGTLGNNFMAAAPGNPVLRRALADAAAAINRGDQDIIWLSTGPGLITRSLAAACAAETWDTLRANTVIWPRRTVLRHISIHCLAGYKESNQHWIRAAFTMPQAAA
jgi:tetratricopeptide (TPR) repeat protein